MKGAPGPRGFAGKKGEAGRNIYMDESAIKLAKKGEQGERGPNGDKGQKGVAGYGRNGLSGEKGDMGPRGEKGDRGADGPQGPRGPPTELKGTSYDYLSRFLFKFINLCHVLPKL